MGRLHPQRNGRGLNIYNPYFQREGVNAVYLLFSNPDAAPLLRGVRDLGLAGAVVTGAFETNPRVAELVDELHPVSERLGTIGMVAQREGRLYGVYQGAFGLREAIARLTDFRDKKMVILGAGNVVRGLLALFEIDDTRPRTIEIYNRTLRRAEELAGEFPWVASVRSIDELNRADGDIFINATSIGSPWNKGDDLFFSDRLVGAFDYVVDVTFVPPRPQLVETAERLGKAVSPGYKMFMFQAKHVLQEVLGHSMNESSYEELMLRDFETNWS